MDAAIQMAVLLLVVAAGYAAHRCNLMGGDFDKRLSAFIIDMACPALILSSVFGPEAPDRTLILPLAAVGFSTYFVLMALAVLVPRLLHCRGDEKGMVSFMVMFANVGFLGYPVVASIFGPQAVFYASLLNMPNNLFVFMVGTPFICGSGLSLKSFDKRILFCPAMIASYLSIVLVALDVRGLPVVLTRPIELIGQITVPGALLIIGSSMATVSLRQAFLRGRVYVITLVRLLVVPLTVYALFKAVAMVVPIDDLVIKINTVVIGMPVASYGTMLCLRYGRDERLMVQTTMVSTLLSAASIPIMAALF